MVGDNPKPRSASVDLTEEMGFEVLGALMFCPAPHAQSHFGDNDDKIECVVEIQLL